MRTIGVSTVAETTQNSTFPVHRFASELGPHSGVQLLQNSVRMYVSQPLAFFLIGGVPVLLAALIHQVLAGIEPRLVGYGDLVVLISIYLPMVPMTIAVARIVTGERCSVRECWSTLPRLGLSRSLYTEILVLAGYTIGILVLILPGVVFATYFSFAFQVFALEGKWGLDALKRSARLLSGHFWRVFLLLVVLGFVVGFVPGLVAGIAQGLSQSRLVPAWSAQLASLVAVSLMAPLEQIGIILIYLDLRQRKEQYDLASLSDHLQGILSAIHLQTNLDAEGPKVDQAIEAHSFPL
jgi:hypothetical protein